MPGPMTAGHHQIEVACNSCHTPFGGVRQGACLDCHAEEFEAAQDSHSESKFSDPRNVADLAKLDVRTCITCHTEHRPEITGEIGVTVPMDFCYACHSDVAEERPTHQEMAFDTCASAGCHNFHDNRVLYEDFLLEHGAAEDDTVLAELPPRDAWISWEVVQRFPLTVADADGPATPIRDWSIRGLIPSTLDPASTARTATKSAVRPGRNPRVAKSAAPAMSWNLEPSSLGNMACACWLNSARCHPRWPACRCSRRLQAKHWTAVPVTTLIR